MDDKIRLVVRMLLAAREMTTIDLGRQLGLGRTPIYDRMQGRKPFTVAEVAAMADMFNVPVSVLFGGPGELLGRSHSGNTDENYPSLGDIPDDLGQAA